MGKHLPDVRLSNFYIPTIPIPAVIPGKNCHSGNIGSPIDPILGTIGRPVSNICWQWQCNPQKHRGIIGFHCHCQRRSLAAQSIPISILPANRHCAGLNPADNLRYSAEKLSQSARET